MQNDREAAYLFLKEKLQSAALQKHCLAVEAIMRALAKRFNENETAWALTGLLHDVDFEATKNDFTKHGALGAEWVEEKFGTDVAKAIRMHNSLYGRPETLMEKSLICADAISGLIIAAALVAKDKKIGSLNVDNILKRFKEKKFAASVSREEIAKCKEIGLSLEQFAKISLDALKSIAPEIGL